MEDYQSGRRTSSAGTTNDVFPDLPEKWREAHRRALAGMLQRRRRSLHSGRRAEFWTQWECRPWYEADGSIGGIIVYTEVVNERKRAMDSLAEEATRRRLLIEQSRDGIVVLDESGNVYEANRRFAEMLGYSPKRCSGFTCGTGNTFLRANGSSR
jgi:PAS domain-containing protein